MRFRFLTLLLLLMAGAAMAQNTKSLQKVLQLKMLGDGGSNGAAIAFHSVNKKYYAAMAGNTSYPLCVFNEQGYLVSGGQVTTLADVRGLWFNTRKAKLQGNAYGENGWFEYTLDGNGIPTEHRSIMENASQPDPQSVGTFAAKLNQVLFFDGRDIYFYDVISGEVKESLSLEVMRKKSGMSSFDPDDYNNSTVFYTGIAGMEIGLVNTADRMVELYSMTGQLGQKLVIPSGVLLYTKFNCSYANGMYWFFDQTTRTWTGYKEGTATSGTSTQPVTTGTLGGGTGSGTGKYTKIVTVGDLYSTYDLSGSNADDVSRWRSEWGNYTVDQVLKLAKEDGWPENINTLTKRDGKRERFTQYNTYYVGDVGTDKVLLWVPKNDNLYVDSDLRLPYDIYMVYKRSAVTLGQKTKPSGATASGSNTKPLTGGTQSNQGRATKITDPGQLYSTYNLEDDESGVANWLRSTYGNAAAAEILKRSVESGWPAAISSFNSRSNYREGFRDYVAYYIADIGSEKVLLWIPMNKNGHMPAACRGNNDIYMVYGRNGLSMGDKVKATVNVTQATGSGTGSGGDDGRTKPITGVLGGGSGSNTNTNAGKTAATGNFQTQFESILKAYGNNFSGIKGTERSASGAIFKDWNTSVKLAGSFDCYVTEGILNDHLEYVADYGTIKSKNAAMLKMNALTANLLKVSGTYAVKRDNVETKEKSIVELFVLKGSPGKEYEYLLVEVGMYKKADTNDDWDVQILVYSEEEDF